MKAAALGLGLGLGLVRRRRAGLAAALLLRGLGLAATPGSLVSTLLLAAELAAWLLAFELGRGALGRVLERRLESWGIALALLSPPLYVAALAGRALPGPTHPALALLLAFAVAGAVAAALDAATVAAVTVTAGERRPSAALALVLAALAAELLAGGATTGAGWLLVVAAAAVAALAPRASVPPPAEEATPRLASALVPIALALPTVHLLIGWWAPLAAPLAAATRLERDAVVGVHVVLAVALAVARYLVRETLLRRAGRRLRESEDRYRRLVEASPDAVLGVEAGRVAFANPAARRLFALDEGATPTADDVGLPELAPTGELPVEHRLATAAGERILELSCREVPLRDGTGWQVVARDVTPLRRLQEEAERMEQSAALGELGASVAHEIRNPLGSLLFNVRYLTRERRDDPAVAAEVAAIDRDADRIQEVIAGVLALARSDDLDQTGARALRPPAALGGPPAAV